MSDPLIRAVANNERNATLFEDEGGGAGDTLNRTETMFVNNANFTLTSKITYDSFIFGKSIWGDSKLFTTSANFATGTSTGDVQTTSDQLSLSATPGSGTWTSPTLNYPASTGYNGIENFEGTTANVLSLYGSGHTISLSTTQVYQGTYSEKINYSWISTDLTNHGVLITFPANKDLSNYSKLIVRVYHEYTGTLTDFKIQGGINTGGGLNALDCSNYINTLPPKDGWYDLEFDISTISNLNTTSIITMSINKRVVTGGTVSFDTYLDLLQTEDTTSNNDWRDLDITYSIPASSTITLDILDSSGSALETGIALASTIDLSTYTTLDESIKLRFNLGSTGGSPTISDFTINWKPDQLGDWGASWVTEETLSGAGEFTDIGRTAIRNWLYDDSGTYPVYSGWGDGVIAASISDTELGNEVGTRNTLSSSRSGATVTYTCILLNSAGNGSTMSELGLFDTLTSGNLFERVVFTGKLKHAYEQLKATVEVTIT